MIDASKSPVPAWRRYGTYILLAVLIAGAAFVIWTKELHHTLSGTSNPPAHTAPPSTTLVTPSHVAATKTPAAKTPATTIPGGIATSSRNPFSS